MKSRRGAAVPLPGGVHEFELRTGPGPWGYRVCESLTPPLPVTLVAALGQPPAPGRRMGVQGKAHVSW